MDRLEAQVDEEGVVEIEDPLLVASDGVVAGEGELLAREKICGRNLS